MSELEAILVEYLDEDAIFGSQEELSPSQVVELLVKYHRVEPNHATANKLSSYFLLKGLSHEMDFHNVDEN